jgi:hypothetical protein
MTNAIRDILDKLTDQLLADTQEVLPVGELTYQEEAEQAINAYILGEVMELIGEDELKGMYTPLQWEIAQDRNYLRQELRNKANKKFGGK